MLEDDRLPDFDISKWVNLNPQEEKKKKAKKTTTKGTKRGKAPKRMTQAMKNLVGLTGEIFVYRWLQSKYGDNVVTPDCWISDNSKRKFRNNRTDDNYGCDFKIRIGKKTYCIEVKSSSGEDEIFELGSSEIRLAIELANKRNTVFSIIHVTNSLSEEPEFHHLPNPYSKKFRSLYRIEDAGLRIRYESK